MSFFARSNESKEAPAHLIIDMMDKVCGVVNKYNNTFKLETGQGYEDLLRAERNGKFHGFLPPDYAKNGYLSFSQSATLGLLIDEVFDKSGKRILSLEPTQWGKTNLLMSLALVLPVVHYLKTGQDAFFAISVPGFKSLLSQSQERMKLIWKTISPLTVRCGKRDIVVADYWTLRNDFNPALPENNVINMRSIPGEKTLVKRIASLSHNTFAYYGEDECQHGQDVRGIAARINRAIGKRDAGYVLLSATPDEALANDKVNHPVAGYVENNYIGMPVVYGHKMRELPAIHHVQKYERRLPKVVAIEQQFGELNDNEDYVAAVTSLLKNKPGGVFLRAPDRLNTRLTGIATLLEKKGIGVIPFYGKLEAPTMEKFREIVKDRQFVVLANNMGRMGDTPPYDCQYYIDPTGEYSTTNAMQQGTVGRASRYGCVCTCFLSQRNADWVNSFYDADGSAAELVHPSALGNKMKHPSSRSRSELYYSQDGEKRKVADMEDRYCYLYSDQNTDEPIIRDLFKKVNAALMRSGIINKGVGTRDRKKTFHQEMCEILNPEVMLQIHDILNLGPREIVNYGEDEGDGKILMPKYELRQARDRADYGSISRNGGGHDRSADCDNLAIWRFTKKVCPVCGQDPNPPTRKGMKRGEITGKLKQRRVIRECCASHVPAEVWLIHLRTRRAVKTEDRARLNVNSELSIVNKAQSRHYDMELS